MEDAVSPYNTFFGALSESNNLDLGIMNDLVSEGEGQWFGMMECSDLFQRGASVSSTLFDPSCFPPASHAPPASNVHDNTSIRNTPQKFCHDNMDRSSFSNCAHLEEIPTEIMSGNQSLHCDISMGGDSSGHSESGPADECGNFDRSEMINSTLTTSRNWLIEPREDLDHTISVKERLVHVLRYVKERAKDDDVLVQLWVPVKRGDRNVLTTCGQPFSLNAHCEKLVNYRTVSTNYLFSAEEDSNMVLGLPGRVFLGRLPEWTPDVRYFSTDEYARVDYAQRYDVRGSLAFPVFEQGRQACLGVVEIVMTTTKISYCPELEDIGNALQAVDLRTSQVLSIPHEKVGNDSYKLVLPEIREIMRTVCETDRLPLAQTWVRCIQQRKKGSRHTDENYADCISTVDVACWVSDPHMWGFHNACSEHHLFEGQGVAGKAFSTNQPCFCPDVTALSKTEYPLSHHARMFGLHAAVAIRLRSIYTGRVDFVLEFFLPVECSNYEEQKYMLHSLSVIVRQICQTLQFLADNEVDDYSFQSNSEKVHTGELIAKHVFSGGTNANRRQEMGISPSMESSGVKSSLTSCVMQAQQKGEVNNCPASAPLECQKQEPVELNIINDWHHREMDLKMGRAHSKAKLQQCQGFDKDSVEGTDSSFGRPLTENAKCTTERKRAKSEKNISLQDLRQYFAGSLKDAAKSIGVCPTTLKRICRQHGITRWPSRELKKVGNSLRKLQLVIDSVQGAEGVRICSLYANFPKTYDSGLTSQSPRASSMVPKLDQISNLDYSTGQTEAVFSIGALQERSQSSSCSHSSSSSMTCSTEVQEKSQPSQLLSEGASRAENRSCKLKRAYSEAQLHEFSKDEEMKPPSRSLSHILLSEHLSSGDPDSLPNTTNSSQYCSFVRVKVTYEEEKIRFSLQRSWDFQDLLREIAKRFHIDDGNVMILKYLDDDSEWVLLTCDADLQECKEIHKSSKSVLKLSVHINAQSG